MALRDGSPLVRVVVGTRAIAARFAHERPAVRDGEWGAQGYVLERTQMWRDALQAPLAARAVRLELCVDEGGEPGAAPAGDTLCIGSDTVTILACATDLQPLRSIVAIAARSIAADTGGWRRFLLPDWFERHRAWRREVGSPIQH